MSVYREPSCGCSCDKVQVSLFFCGEYYDIKKMAHYYRWRFEPVARTLPTTHFSHVYRVLIQCVLTWILKGGIELIFFNAPIVWDQCSGNLALTSP